MNDPVEFLDLDDVVGLARALLGDPAPIRDIGLLGSAVARPQTTAFGEDGQFEVTAQLLHIGERSTVTSKNETRITPRLSFRFTAIEPVQERQLQQVIFALERLARDKANRFQ